MEKTTRQIRYEQYCAMYPEQLRLLGYIKSLEADNDNIRRNEAAATTGRARRRAKKLIKINDKDIKKYKKMLSAMPEVPEFK